MSGGELDRRGDAFSVLRRFAARRVAAEQCEFCSHAVAADHQHVVEPATRRLVCVCDACAVLFSGDHPRFRRVPRSVRVLRDFRMTEAQWDGLLIPIGMAFFYESSQAGRMVALYPSPAGPTESLLPLETWQDIVRDNAVLARMQPDVEALVANRLGAVQHETTGASSAPEYYILPIDECFRLVGLIRLHWKGLSGGVRVWGEMARFFAAIRERAEPSPEMRHA